MNSVEKRAAELRKRTEETRARAAKLIAESRRVQNDLHQVEELAQKVHAKIRKTGK